MQRHTALREPGRSKFPVSQVRCYQQDASICLASGLEVVAADHSSLDISDQSQVSRLFVRERPDVVINCAAATDVDRCQADPEYANAANARGPEVLADACRKQDALFITISTDYVFDGHKQGFYTQRDQPHPLSVYGMSKLTGEKRARETWERTIVARTGYVFGPGGTNFLSQFLTRLRCGEQLRVIDDMHGTPTYAEDLAARLYELALDGRPGIFHVVNAGEGVSFAEFTLQAAEAAALPPELLIPVSVASLKLPAPRPRNSRLRCLLSEELGLAAMPDWRDALKRFLANSLPANAISI